MSSSHSSSTVDPHRHFSDPLAHYQQHYDGVTRGELCEKNRKLYDALRRNEFLEHVPQQQRFFSYYSDPVSHYKKHYHGLTRGELQQQNAKLYAALHYRGQLKHVPRKNQSYGRNPLAFYHKHYTGMTRGQLQQKNRGLYDALRYRGLLDHVPFKSLATTPPTTCCFSGCTQKPHFGTTENRFPLCAFHQDIHLKWYFLDLFGCWEEEDFTKTTDELREKMHQAYLRELEQKKTGKKIQLSPERQREIGERQYRLLLRATQYYPARRCDRSPTTTP